jgi:hypothetical protein
VTGKPAGARPNREGKPLEMDMKVSDDVRRFLVTAPIHLRLAVWADTAAFANWIEGRGPKDRETWLVTCFGQHAASFLEAARDIGVTVEEIEGSNDDMRYVMLAGEPGSGWSGSEASP